MSARSTPTTLDEMESQQRPQRGIWWLASYPKSGSTWMRMVINAAVTKFPVDINAAYQYVASDLAKHLYQHTAAIPVTQFGPREIIYYRSAALLNHLAIFPQRDSCLKTHHANVTLDDIPLCPAKLSRGALYIVRDPRDVVISFARHVGKTIDEAIDLMGSELAMITDEDNFFHYLSSWTTHVNSWLGPDNPIPTGVVRYEDILTAPFKTFRRALDLLGMGFVENDALEFAIEQADFANLKKQEDQKGFKETGKKQKRFFNNGRAGVWRDVLSAKQVERIESQHAQAMQAVGYATEEISEPTEELSGALA